MDLMDSSKRSVKNVNRLFLFIVIWILGAPILLALFIREMSIMQSLLLSQLLYLLPVLLYMLIKRIPVRSCMPFRKIKISTCFMIVLFTFLTIPLVTCLNVLSLFFVTNHLATMELGLQDNSVWLNLLLLAVIPAVLEEFIFRGVFYHAYRGKGVLTAGIGCGLTFGLMHMNFNQFFYALVLGVVFCLLLEATGSIFASVIAHFVINGWSVVLLDAQKRLTAYLENMGETVSTQTNLNQEQLLITFGVIAVIALATTCMAGCVLVWIAKHSGRLEHLKNCFKKKPAKEGVSFIEKTFITPAYVIAGLICIIYMILVG